MKSFLEYLTESKKVYEFKIKLAGDFEKASEKLKSALSQYKVESCSAGKRLPIAEMHSDFPNHKNTNVTIFDVTTAYPVTSAQVRAVVSEKLGCSLECVKVRNLQEQAEDELNHANDEKTGESLLSKDYEATSEGQKLVGDKQVMSLLKELNKVKHAGEQYTGVNDALLASKAPSEPASTSKDKFNTKSPVGSRSTKKPTAKTVGVK